MTEETGREVDGREGDGQEGERQRGEPWRVRVGSRQEETQLDPWASG